MQALKWALWVVGGLVLLAAVAVAIFAATFDANRYKPEIIELVRQQTGRTLAMDGDIRLAFFPHLGGRVARVSLSGPGGKGDFARVEEARVGVALLPLLSRQVIVDEVALTGLDVNLVKYKDGRTNFDDLIGKDDKPQQPSQKPPAGDPPAAPAAIDIGGIVLRNAHIGWRDEAAGTDVRLSEVDLRTGRIASNAAGEVKLSGNVEGKQPAMKVRIEADAGYRIDFEKGAAALSGLDVKVAGDAAGFAGLDARLRGEKLDLDPAASRIEVAGVDVTAKSRDGLDAKLAIPRLQLAPDRAESKAINGEVKLAKPDQRVDAKLALSALEAKGKLVSFARFEVDFDAKAGELGAQGKLTTPVTLDLNAAEVQLPGIAGDVAISGPAVPNKSMKAAVKGGARANWQKQNADAQLAMRLDDSNLQAKVVVANWSKPAINFDVAADRLNLDRYFPPQPAAPVGAVPAPAGDAKSDGKGAASAAAEKPIDLSGLKALNATGSVRVGALQASNIKADNVNVGVKAAGGRLDLSPMSAALYQGTLAGAVSVNANTNGYAIKQQLANVSIGPLLRDAANKDVLEGRGTFNLDVTSTGTTPSALKRALNGSAALALHDGAIKGVDVAGALRRAQALLGSQKAQEQLAKGGEKTDFTELTGTFVIKNGVARNDDLQAKSPHLRLAGAGNIDIPAGTVDYLLKASVVNTATGQGGKDRVSGVTAPVKISGPFESLTYSVDVTALATDVAKDALARELERRLGGGDASKSGADGGKNDAGKAARDILRGLFGGGK